MVCWTGGFCCDGGRRCDVAWILEMVVSWCLCPYSTQLSFRGVVKIMISLNRTIEVRSSVSL